MHNLLLVNTIVFAALCFIWKKSDPLNLFIKLLLATICLFNLMALLGKL